MAALLGLVRVDDHAARPATSSSSRAATTRSTRPPHEYKEEIKVGYNLRRKIVLMAVWVLLAAGAVARSPSLFGLIEPAAGFDGFVHDVGIAWLALGVAGLLFRVAAAVAARRTLQTGLVWMTKILTDPFHDIMLYHKAPLHLLRGELIDPMPHVRHER